MGLMFLLYFLSVNISFLSPVARAVKDFAMSDLYYHILWSGEKPETSEAITIVDITDQQRRADLARTIRQIAALKPAALGVDIIFEGEKDDPAGNDSLTEALDLIPSQTVTAFKLLNWNPEREEFRSALHSFFIPTLPLMEGYANVLNYGVNGTVRSFTVSRRLGGAEGMEVYSLPAMLYMAAINDTLPAATKRPGDRLINYIPTRFPVVRYDSLQAKADLISDRFVLLGTVGEEQDMHYTPIGKLPGVEVQAYSLQTLFQQRDIRTVGNAPLLALVFLFCYLTQLLQYGAVRCVKRREDTFSVFLSSSFVFLRVVTFLWLAFLAWMGFILYIKCNTYLAMTWIFAAVVLVAESRGLYSAFIKTLRRKYLNRFPGVRKSLYFED